MVLNHIFSRREGEGRVEYFNPAELDIQRDEKGEIVGAVARADGKPVTWEGMGTMSKSKNNGVDPNEMIARYGADTARLYMLFTSPPEQSLEWSDAGIEGAARFLRRLWRLVHEHVTSLRESGGSLREGSFVDLELTDSQRALRRSTHSTIAKVSDDVGRRYTFNTAIAAIMELLNEVARFEDESPQGRATRHEALASAVLLLAPMVPHICHVLWQTLGHAGTVADARWPTVDPVALVRDSITLVVQVNGKLRSQIEVAREAPREVVERTALDDANIRRFIDGVEVKRVIVVPGRLVNIVVAP